MSLHPQPEHPIPEQAQHVAPATFPKSTLALHIADVLDLELTDLGFDHAVFNVNSG